MPQPAGIKLCGCCNKDKHWVLIKHKKVYSYLECSNCKLIITTQSKERFYLEKKIIKFPKLGEVLPEGVVITTCSRRGVYVKTSNGKCVWINNFMEEVDG